MNKLFVSLFVCFIFTIISTQAQENSTSPVPKTDEIVAIETPLNTNRVSQSGIKDTPSSLSNDTRVNLNKNKKSSEINTTQEVIADLSDSTTSGSTDVVNNEKELLSREMLESLIDNRVHEIISHDQSDKSTTSLIISCIALILSVYTLWLVKNINNDRTNEHRGSSHRNSSSSGVSSTRNENYATIAYVTSLEKKIDDLIKKNSSSKVEQSTQSSILQNNIVNNGGNRPPVPPKPTFKKYYASQVQSEGFPISAVSEKEDDYSFVVLNISNGNGTFSISTNPNTQDYVIRNFGYTAASVCQVKEQVQSPSRIETVIPGQVRREGNMWKVVVKATIKLI